MSLCVCVCELIERAAMSVRRPSSCLSLLPPSLSFLPSPPSPCLSLSHFPSFNWSTFFLVSLFSLFPSSLVSLVEPGDEIYSQALDPQRVCLCRCISPFPLCLAGSVRPSAALHNNRAQSKAEHSTFCAGRGGVGLSHRQKNECTSPWGIPSSPVFLYYIVQPLSLSLSQSSSVSLSFSLNCLITTSCISGQHSTDLPPPPTPPTHKIWHLFSISLNLISTSVFFLLVNVRLVLFCPLCAISWGRWVCFYMSEQLTER